MKLVIRAFGLVVLLGGFARADDAAVRRELIEAMRQGYAAYAASVKASDTPNLINLLQNRYPDDLNSLADSYLPAYYARQNLNPGQITAGYRRLFVEIQRREAGRIKTAPGDSLKAVVKAERGLMQAAARQAPQQCMMFVAGSKGMQSTEGEIGRWNILRLAAILNALADGRDKPVTSRRKAETADRRAMGAGALKRGFDVKSWTVLIPDRAKIAPAAEVCAALISYLDALATTEGELGETLLAAHVSGSLQ